MKIKLLDSAPTESRISVNLDSGKQTELWLEANVELDKTADCWLYFMLPICMGLAEDLEVTGTITTTALNSFHQAQQALLEKHPHLKKISIKHEEPITDTRSTEDNRAIASFFSGGLDSAYTAETIPEINTLISIWGFDIQLWHEKHWKLTVELLEKQAAEMNRELILIKTNIREISNGLLYWGRDYHGSALAGVANALSNKIKKVYISATHNEDTNRWGQFPDLSRAYSNSYQEIIEYGPKDRAEKALALADNPRSRLMRVCYRNTQGLVNCGVCQKCVRTRLEFALIQAKYRPIGLEKRPSLKELISVRVDKNNYLFFKNSIGFARSKKYPNTLLPLIAVAIAYFKSMPFYRKKLKADAKSSSEG